MSNKFVCLYKWIWQKVICLLLAFQIFNCSVDIQDFHPNYVPEDLNYNEMESIVEIIAEKVLSIDNFSIEYDESESEETTSAFSKKILDHFIPQTNSELPYPATIEFIREYLSGSCHFVLKVFPDIDSPPPQFIQISF